MQILLAVVVMHMQRADAVFHDLELVLHAGTDVGVAGVEDKVEIQVSQFQKLRQTLGGGKLVGNVLQEDSNVPLPRKIRQFLEGVERGVELALMKLLARH